MALYLAVQPRMYRDGVVSLLPPRHRAVGARVLDDAGATLRAWVVGQLIAMLVLGALTVYAFLLLFGVERAGLQLAMTAIVVACTSERSTWVRKRGFQPVSRIAAASSA